MKQYIIGFAVGLILGGLAGAGLYRMHEARDATYVQPPVQTPTHDTFRNIELPLDQIKLSNLALDMMEGRVYLRDRIGNRSQYTLDDLVIGVSFYDKEEKLGEASITLGVFEVVGGGPERPIFNLTFYVPPGEARDFKKEGLGMPHINQPLESLRAIYIVRRATCSINCYLETIDRDRKEGAGSR